MPHLAIEILFAGLSLCGIAFYGVALWSAHVFRREARREPPTATLSPVSILKPLKGVDSATYAAIRSHCELVYDEYEIIFGINEIEDEAAPIVRRVISEFPNRNIRLIVCSEVLGANRKVSNLIHLLREARYPFILVNDGDIKVAPNYLQSVMRHFADPETGMVTCPYRGRAGNTLPSRLEALGISTDFIAGVLTARFTEGGLDFGLGSTLAMGRAALEKIGGFLSVVDYLADDYELGARISGAGFKVILAHEVVETAIPAYTFSQFWEHQLRWARTMRVSRPGGYRGLALTFGLIWAILLVLVAPHHGWTWALLITAALMRFAVAISVGWRTLNDSAIFPDLWLLPARDMIALAVWIWSYAGDTVSWRGEKFTLSGGRMHPVSHASNVAPANVSSEVQRR